MGSFILLFFSTFVFKYTLMTDIEKNLLDQIEENIGYLTYDMDPIGPPTEFMQLASKENSIKSIAKIQSLLEELNVQINQRIIS